MPLYLVGKTSDEHLRRTSATFDLLISDLCRDSSIHKSDISMSADIFRSESIVACLPK